MSRESIRERHPKEQRSEEEGEILEFVHHGIAHSCLVQRRIVPQHEGDGGSEEHHGRLCRHSEQ